MKIFIDFKVIMVVLVILKRRENGYIIGIRVYLKISGSVSILNF